MFCREQVARFQEHAEALEARGAKVYAIGNGTAPMAQDFVEQFSVTYPVFTDPGRRSYAAAGMRRSFGLGLKSIALAKRAMAAGHRQGATRGDPWQQGGILVITPQGEVRFHHVDGAAGESGEVEAVMASLPS